MSEDYIPSPEARANHTERWRRILEDVPNARFAYDVGGDGHWVGRLSVGSKHKVYPAMYVRDASETTIRYEAECLAGGNEDYGASPAMEALSAETPDFLMRTLQAAYHQATMGKGRERHGGDMPFEEQPIMAIAKLLDGSIDGHLFQVMKKAQEAGRMAKRGGRDAATRELYGVIIYAAAAARVLETDR